MTISTTNSRVAFSGNGITTVFSFPYFFFDNTDLIVILKAFDGTETTLTLNTHYTVTGADLTAGGSVTMITPPATGEHLTIVRNTPAKQEADWDENDSSPAETLETALDRVTLLAQRLNDRMDRTVRLTEGFTDTFDPQLPPSLLPDCTIVTDPLGRGLAMGPSVLQVAAAEGYAEAALVSQNVAQNSAAAANLSAIAAAASTSNASGQAATATTQAAVATAAQTNASSSATAAGVQASNSAISAAASAASATASATSAAAALTSQNASATSATNAATSEANALSSKNAAATSETNAANSALSASATLAAALWRDVVFLTSADSPKTLTAADSGKLFVCDTTVGGINIIFPQISTITLPFAAGVKLEAGSNAVGMYPSGTDTIDGSPSKILTTLNSGCQLIGDTDPSPDAWTAIDFGVSGGTVGGNFVVDTFSGNGAQTSFTLTIGPGSKNNTFVSISGILQSKSTYSLSGTTLTFLTAPTAGTNNVEVTSGTTLPIGTPGDGTVTNAKFASMPPSTMKGNITGGSNPPTDLTPSQVAAFLSGLNLNSGIDIYTVPTTIAMTSASKRIIRIQGSSGTTQTVTLPDATTLQPGTQYIFNIATGITVNINGFTGTLIFSTVGQNAAPITLLVNSTQAGTWSRGGAITGVTQGGTGQVTANDSLNALLPTQTSNATKVLTTDGTNSSWSYKSGLVAQVYSTAGTYTYTPGPNQYWARVTGRPGGGGGGGGGAGGLGALGTGGGGGGKAGGGGGSASSITLTVAVTPNVPITVIVGAGGAGGNGGISGGSAPTAGGNGASSSFGNITFANGTLGGLGGGAGSNGNAASGATAGTANASGGAAGTVYNGAGAGTTGGNGSAGGAAGSGTAGLTPSSISDTRFGITTQAGAAGGAAGAVGAGYGGGGGGGGGGSSGITMDQNIYGLGLMDTSGKGGNGGGGSNGSSLTQGSSGSSGSAGTAGRGGGGGGGGGGAGGNPANILGGGNGGAGGPGCDGLIAIEYCG